MGKHEGSCVDECSLLSSHDSTRTRSHWDGTRGETQKASQSQSHPKAPGTSLTHSRHVGSFGWEALALWLCLKHQIVKGLSKHRLLGSTHWVSYCRRYRDGAWEHIFLTSSQVMLRMLVLQLHVENPSPVPSSTGSFYKGAHGPHTSLNPVDIQSLWTKPKEKF